ncbi:MAG: DUF2092 domain-containing protein [Armatimonadota bacterium]|nr:DUF2092 domain-containing protein [Armatimonadota bacterium]
MRVVWAVVAGLAVTLTGTAQQNAKAFLDKVLQKYRNANSWELSADFTLETTMGANQSRQVIEGTMLFQRPNMAVIKMRSAGMPLGEFYCDGKHAYQYNPTTKQYLKQPAPADLKEANILILGPWFGQLLMALEQDLDKTAQNAKFEFRGTQTIAGKPTRVVEVSETKGNRSSKTRVYVGVRDSLVYRIEQTEVVRPAQQGVSDSQANIPPRTTKIVVNLRYVSFNKRIPVARFRFTPPKDAKEIKLPQPTRPTPAVPPQGNRQ